MIRNNAMPKPQIGNSELISQVNSRLVLQAVRVMQPTFRAAVARRTGLKPATVTVIVNDLLEKRMIQEVDAPPDIALRTSAADVAGQSGREAHPRGRFRARSHPRRADQPGAEEMAYREHLIDRAAKPPVIIEKILKLCRDVLGKTPREKMLGAGLSLPGLIDLERGVLISSTNMPHWHDVPIRDILAKELKLPVHVDRSVRLAALYEEWVSPHLDDQTTLIISLGTGVGFSLINRGQLYVGNCGFDGEIGHTVVDINGQVCECGSRGCLETFVSASTIVARARRGIAKGAASR